MIESTTIDGGLPVLAALDWDGLVAEGRDLLAAMTDGAWTNFNAHDPGITLLETFAYALTDLAYRSGHPIPDLFVGSDTLPGPGALLTGRAVTPADLRAVALRVPGVFGAWIEPSDHPTLRLHYTIGAGEFTFAREGVASADVVDLMGVYRVVIAKSPHRDMSAGEVARTVASALHRQRGLAEDFDAVDVLAPLPIAIDALIEIDDPARTEAVLTAAHAALDAYCAPAPAWSGANLIAEAAYDGPAIDGQQLADGAAAPPRRSALQLSDIIALLGRVEGVRAVRRVRAGVTGEDRSGPLRWSLPIPPDRAPIYDARASHIVLVAGGATALDSATRADLSDRPDTPPLLAAEPPVVVGRDRRVADYRPLRYDLPRAYGVAPGAMTADAPASRRAEAAQLRAFLAMLDAVLANSFAQLAGVGDLLGAGTGPSYRTQLAEPIAGADELPIHTADLTADLVQQLGAPADAGVGHRNRLLAHLLARFGEEVPSTPPPARLGNGPSLPTAGRMLASRADFLADFPRLSAARGTGADLLDPADEPAVLERIRLKLGLSPHEGGRLRLIEHILLRPTADDDDPDQSLLAGAAGPDPYSLQLSLVADEMLRPIADPLARVVRAEIPAHLILHIRWLGADAFDAFAASYRRWRTTLAAQRREALGFGTEAA